MGDIRLPIKISIDYYIAISTSAHAHAHDEPPYILAATKPRLKLPRLLRFSRAKQQRSKSQSPDAPNKRIPARRRWILFARRCNSDSNPTDSSSHSSTDSSSSSSRFSISLEGDADKPQWDEDDLFELPLSKLLAPPPASPPVELKVEDRGKDDERARAARNRGAGSLALKLLVKLPVEHWERKLAAVNATGRMVRMGLARVRSRAEEMNIKIRTKPVHSTEGKVRVFRGEKEEELWYLKKVSGLRCQPLAEEAIYGTVSAQARPRPSDVNVNGAKDLTLYDDEKEEEEEEEGE